MGGIPQCRDVLYIGGDVTGCGDITGCGDVTGYGGDLIRRHNKV